MGKLAASDLLSVWDSGRAQPRHRQALLLLSAAYPEDPPEKLAALSMGERDSRLLALREQLFGPQLAATAACPACSEKLELNFDVADIQAEAPADSGRHELTACGYRVFFRLPDSNDLAALPAAADRESRRRILLARCVTEIRRNAGGKPAEEVPEEVIAAVSERMAQVDPQAVVELALECPACGHRWLALFDIASYLWTEIEDWARRILQEVHLLAISYGWREADILAMSPARRCCYLDMLGFRG